MLQFDCKIKKNFSLLSHILFCICVVPVQHTATHKKIIIKKQVLNNSKNAYIWCLHFHLLCNFYTKPVDSPSGLKLVHVAYCYAINPVAFDGNSLIKKLKSDGINSYIMSSL